MSDLSPPPAREKLPVTQDTDKNSWAEMPLAWQRFFVRLVENDANVEPKVYTMATRPLASANIGRIIYVSDGGAGAVFQGSNGTAWVNLG